MSSPSTATHPPLVCWSCHERTLGTHFCSSCGKLLQLPKQVDYFELFEMPRKLWIEMGGLDKKFLELSWKLHPDKFVNASAEEQALSLKRSSEMNDALLELVYDDRLNAWRDGCVPLPRSHVCGGGGTVRSDDE